MLNGTFNSTMYLKIVADVTEMFQQKYIPPFWDSFLVCVYKIVKSFSTSTNCKT